MSGRISGVLATRAAAGPICCVEHALKHMALPHTALSFFPLFKPPLTRSRSIADDLHLPSVTITICKCTFSADEQLQSAVTVTSYLHGGKFRTLLSCYHCVEVSTRNSEWATPGTLLHVSIIMDTYCSQATHALHLRAVKTPSLAACLC